MNSNINPFDLLQEGYEEPVEETVEEDISEVEDVPENSVNWADMDPNVGGSVKTAHVDEYWHKNSEAITESKTYRKLYANYKRWCKKEGYVRLNNRTFEKTAKRLGFTETPKVNYPRRRIMRIRRNVSSEREVPESC